MAVGSGNQIVLIRKPGQVIPLTVKVSGNWIGLLKIEAEELKTITVQDHTGVRVPEEVVEEDKVL